MSRASTALSLVAVLLFGCVSFYPNPRSSEPAAIFIEKGERTALDRYRYFKIAEIDGLPVSHMGASNDGNEIRVQPGTRRILFTVGYLNGLGAGQHRAVFPLELNVEAGKRYQIGGSVDGNNVVFTITDLSNEEAPWVRQTATGYRVQPNMTISVPGGGFVTIPSRQ